MKLPRLLLALILTSLCARAAHACGATDTCADVQASLGGEVIISGFSITWNSDAADSGISRFAVKRYPTGDSSSMSSVGSKSAFHDCDSHDYVELDDPGPSGTGTWSYRVSVVLTDQTVACSYDVTPSGQ